LESDSLAEYDYGVPYRTALDKVMSALKNHYPIWAEFDVFGQQKLFSFLFEVNLEYDKKEGYRTLKYTVLKRVLEEIKSSGSVDVKWRESKLTASVQASHFLTFFAMLRRIENMFSLFDSRRKQINLLAPYQPTIKKYQIHSGTF
jgi:hypothetical protein